MASTAEIHGRLAAKGLPPSEHFVASACVDAGLLAGSRRDHGISLEGSVRGIPDRRARAGTGHGLAHFDIDWDRERATCPQGKTLVSWRLVRGGDGESRIHAQFSQADCGGSCALRALCASATAARHCILVQPCEEYVALKAARERMADPAWQERYRRRAGVEGTLSQAVRTFGIRRSR